MTEQNPASDAERLPEEAARRLLQRASELEAARSADLSVAELRAAAREAGITPGAFEQALAESRETHHTSGVALAATRHGRLTRFWPGALAVAALMSILVIRMLFP